MYGDYIANIFPYSLLRTSKFASMGLSRLYTVHVQIVRADFDRLLTILSVFLHWIPYTISIYPGFGGFGFG